MKVWIDENFCTGDGLCEELCPAMFVLGDDGLAHVRNDGVSAASMEKVDVPADLQAAVLDAQDQCAGECIYTSQA